jgi:hypothetical protein
MPKTSKLPVTRGETFALECAIRSYRNKNSFLKKLELDLNNDTDGRIKKAGDDILADLRKLRRRITDGRARQTYK